MKKSCLNCQYADAHSKIGYSEEAYCEERDEYIPIDDVEEVANICSTHLRDI